MTALPLVAAKWVDFHCHLDLYPDHAQLISECERERIATLAVTTTPLAWARNKEMAEGSTHVRVALGLHPQLVAERENEIALFERLLPESRYVGEVGLDASPRFYKSLEAQERVFERVLRACAEQGDKVLTLHSVRAVSKLLQYLEKTRLPDRGRVVMHWFTGSVSEARRAIDMGCYFSVNSEMLRSPRLRSLIVGLPLDRILTETDGPFVQVDGVAVRPRSVAGTLTALAPLRGIEPEAMRVQVLRNLAIMLKQ
ncbi:Qat anti-phage system TatD family nuclease QatD [Aromatoleum toluclasticum]|uniref:Qat anti-phage system TatD family nuclease QatD n=1 Tax=Aromatoleum toluclasticum TaxID=92003 RepID=UPI0003793EB1|nr:Qat anti-phage system TatD family nuclease QatD [Aromatoleum toluclasticum]